MRNNCLFILAFIITTNSSLSNDLKLNVGFGAASSNSAYTYNSIIGPYAIQGHYNYSSNISYPFFGKGFGLFFEANNKRANIIGISFRNSIIVSGLSWRIYINKSTVELLSGFGYGWDKYDLTDARLGSYKISNEMSVFHTGFNIYLPMFDMLDIMIGMRITQNNKSHISASFKMRERDLTVPSILYGGVIGLSLNLFGDSI